MGRQSTGAVAASAQGVGDLRGDHGGRVRRVLPRRRNLLPLLGGLLVSGPLYLGLGFVLAKFGYQRKTLAELRTPRAAPAERCRRERRSTVRAAPPGTDAPHLERSEPAVEGPAPVTCVIAIDAGTTGIRSRAVFTDGSPSIASYREFTQHFPQPGWVEHDPTEIWEAVRATLHDVVEQVGASSVAAIGITNQRETVVAWDRATGKPYGRAIVWQDRRTAARCDELAAAGALDLVRQRTGLVLDPYFSGTKLEWLLGPGGVPVTEHLALGTIDAWLIWNLTGGEVFATDATNASRTMLFDIARLRWDEELGDLLHVPIDRLPAVAASSGRVGRHRRTGSARRRDPDQRHRR